MSNSNFSPLIILETQIGYPPGNGPKSGTEFLPIDPSVRQYVINWCVLNGMNQSSLRKSSNLTLAKMYNISNYFNACLREQKNDPKIKQNKPKFNIDISQNIPEPDPEIDEESFENALGIESASPNPILNSTPITSPISSSPRISIETIKNLISSTTKTFLDSQKLQLINDLNLSLKEGKETLSSEIKDLLNSLGTTINDKINLELTNIKQEIKKSAEDIIFREYISHRQTHQNSPQNLIAENSPETPTLISNSQNSFIPKIDPNYYFDPYSTKVIRSALNMSKNLFVYGDTGCGKTTHLEQVCAVMNRGLIRINPHDGITREMFLGSMKLINSETKFVEGALPIAMRNGYVLLVDEFSFLPPNLTAILNPVGENGGKLYIPETSEWISPAPGFCIFATDNTGGKGDRTGNYTGTEVQNTATLDRFSFCIKMDYLPINKEQEMLNNRFPDFSIVTDGNQDKTEIEKMLLLAHEVRGAFSRGELSLTLSTRKLIDYFDQRENNFEIPEALNNILLSWLDDDDLTLVKTFLDRLGIINLQHPVPFAEFQNLCNQNLKVNAIKYLRQLASEILHKSLGLREAKDLTEQYIDGLISIEEVESKMRELVI